MNRIIAGLLAVIGLVVTLSGCHTSGRTPQQKTGTAIPYTVARHYFPRNDVKPSVLRVITRQDQFQASFGSAAVMGPDGRPTPIDFGTHYVIAVTHPATNLATTLTPAGLQQEADGTIMFTYRVTTGQPQSYTSTPCLLIIVDRSHQGEVRLHELTDRDD